MSYKLLQEVVNSSRYLKINIEEEDDFPYSVIRVYLDYELIAAECYDRSLPNLFGNVVLKNHVEALDSMSIKLLADVFTSGLFYLKKAYQGEAYTPDPLWYKK